MKREISVYLKILSLASILLISVSCSNEFEHEASNWEYVTTSNKGVEAYVDTLRVECDDKMCKAWTKLMFPSAQKMSQQEFHKSDNPHINLNSKRVDSMRYYYCFTNIAMMTSYQLYDEKDKLIDAKWINKPELEPIRKNTLEYDLFHHVCKPLLQEDEEENADSNY
ncbi:MAG: hypothetical protein MK033_07295 [Candidatus Caenarcaniphilales bacterium]|nr:hypothetical protein [Candidatus Caenarcaniphilales bacterium]